MSLKYLGRFKGDTLMYSLGPCRILLSGPKEREQIGWHFSISCENRNPTWEEQRNARNVVTPDNIFMVSILPPKAQYVNIHPFTFHWYEAGPKFFDIETGQPKS